MEKEKEAGPSSGSKRRDWPLLLLLGLYPFIGGFIYSLQAPFYPIEAQSKGVSVTVIGFVYGVFELTSFFMSLVAGAMLSRVGLVPSLHLGILLTGLSTIGLGLISFVHDRFAFVALSIALRVVQAIGAAFRALSYISMATFAFPKTVGTVVASLESMARVGACLGVVTGGALMQVSGYQATFVLSGCGVLLVLPVTILMLRKRNVGVKGANSNEAPHVQGAVAAKHSTRIGLWTLLRTPSIALPTYLLVCSAGSNGFALSIMEPNLKQFDPSPLQIGLIFMCSAGAYLVTSPTLGYLYDRLKSQPMALFRIQYAAPVLILVAFAIMGPLPGAPFEPSMPLTAVGLALLGIGCGSASSSSYLIAVQNGRKVAAATGNPDDELHVHELISGIWRAAISLGMFVAPSLSGALFDAIGFRAQCLLIIGLHAANILLLFVSGLLLK